MKRTWKQGATPTAPTPLSVADGVPRDIAAVLAKVRTTVYDCGWALIHVHRTGGAPAISYTIGFRDTLGVPDALLVGASPADARAILNRIGRWLHASPSAPRRLPTGRLVGVVHPPFDLGIVDLGTYAHTGLLHLAARYYGTREFPIVQVLVPDAQNRLPGFDADCDPVFASRQRVPVAPPP